MLQIFNSKDRSADLLMDRLTKKLKNHENVLAKYQLLPHF